ncbi:hypothetical protein FG379_002924 [Cryptosporidium bovis]|uniref:uncharacterized protein n=1 Tax=Cryptosporidium bovis TaxID=310047 RepID=UPI003519E8F9|nr:hypothetical protein FG379_002924 [Cryptosporidium bovis]
MRNLDYLLLLLFICACLPSTFGEGVAGSAEISLINDSGPESSGVSKDTQDKKDSTEEEEEEVEVEEAQDVQESPADSDASTAAEELDKEVQEHDPVVESVPGEQVEESPVETSDEDQPNPEESLQVHNYTVPLRLACETRKLICHNLSSSAITIQGSRTGSALFASFDSTLIRAANVSSEDIVSASLTINKIGGSRTLPVRVDVLNLESNSSRISRSSVLETVKAVLPRTPNLPVDVDVTDAIKSLIDSAKDPDNISLLISAHSRSRFGDILTFPTQDYPNGLSLQLATVRLLQTKESRSVGDSEESGLAGSKALASSIFSGSSFYIASGILVTVVVVAVVLMFM